jgi:4'-phosphopantetheinyl transferase EntD
VEEAQLGAAVVNSWRRRESTAAGWCARRVLAAAGAPDPAGPLPRARRGEPLWPAGFTSSIEHRAAYRAAVAVPADRVRVLGIDAERAHLATPPAVPVLPWQRLLFSVEEAVCTVWFPLAGTPLAFRSVRVGL